MKIQWAYVFWVGFILNIITGIILVNTLSFKSPGEQTGFILSVIVLYSVPYLIFTLHVRATLYIIRKKVLKNQLDGLLIVKTVLYLFPFIAFYGVLNLLIFTVPKAISENHLMNLNGISMALGLLLGGIRMISDTRKQFPSQKKDENRDG